jgi:hypothetical protein
MRKYFGKQISKMILVKKEEMDAVHMDDPVRALTKRLPSFQQSGINLVGQKGKINV